MRTGRPGGGWFPGPVPPAIPGCYHSSLLLLRPGRILLLLLLVSACAQKLPVDEGRLVIALPGAPVNVDPRVATDAYGEQILQMTHASLVGRDAAGGPLPNLAPCGGA